MRRQFRRGLVVGKFAPLHRGHELLIRRACEQCEEVIVLSYNQPEMIGCEPDKREQWLAELFPQTRRLVLTQSLLDTCLPGVRLPLNCEDDSIHRQFVGRLCCDLLGVDSVDAVFTSESYGDGFAAELTTYFQARNSAAPQVVHVLVDQARSAVPISGTALRADVHGLRQWLSPAVYASFVEPVCLLGGESSGKSTLAIALAQRLQTVSVPEYGRELWEAKGGALRPDDMLHIAETQIAREEQARRNAHRFLFCDTSPLTTLFYARDLSGVADAKLEQLALRPYRLAVLCEPDFPFVQDGTRRDAAFRERQHLWYLEMLASSGQPWMLASGSVADRVGMVCEALGV
ncbi:MAG: ATPase [Verrucomicrobiaceae bacterium]|nr:MAG: ATPase [Verrucomicrobiaceae bacterium]